MAARKSFSESSELSSDFVSIVSRDPRPVRREFMRETEHQLPCVRFGDRYWFWNGNGYKFKNPFVPSGFDIYSTKSSKWIALLGDQLAVADLKSVRLLNKEFEVKSSIPLDFSYQSKNVTRAEVIKLNSTHLLGLDRVVREIPKVSPGRFNETRTEQHIWCLNTQTQKWTRTESQQYAFFPRDVTLAALPSPDKKQNHFAAATNEKIFIYEVSEEKNPKNNDTVEIIRLVSTIACEQGGRLYPSPCGQYWITEECSHDSPNKLWRVDHAFQPTLVIPLTRYVNSCWFSGHFLQPIYSKEGFKIYATHPETLVTYELDPELTSPCAHRFFQQDDTLLVLANGKVVLFLEKNFFESDAMVNTVSLYCAELPLPVARLACSYLGFFSKMVFSPLIPESLPKSMHQEARVLQWQLREKPDSLYEMRGVLQRLPARFESEENYQAWIKQYNLQNHDIRVKKFFDDVAKEMLTPKCTLV